MENEIKFVDQLQAQRRGDYQYVILDKHQYLTENKILNYIHPDIEIKMTQEKGRGLFVTRDFKRGDMLIVDKAIA